MASDYKKELDNLVSIVLKESASDLHLAEGRQPTIRVSSFLVPLVKEPVLTRTDIKGLLDELLEPQKKKLILHMTMREVLVSEEMLFSS